VSALREGIKVLTDGVAVLIVTLMLVIAALVGALVWALCT
jgi:hypothetical protein